MYAFWLIFAWAFPTVTTVYANLDESPGIINKIYIDTVRDVGFSVSWTTDTPSNGSVTWGTTIPPVNTISDPISNTTTHYVSIVGLSPNKTYYFQVNSGSDFDDNQGSFYQVTTGPSISTSPGSKSVWGYLYQPDGTTPVPNAIVYLRIQDNDGSGSTGNSQWISARADNSGIWNFTLDNNIRTNDLQAYYTFNTSTDNLRIVGQGGEAGSKGVEPDIWIIAVPNQYPAQIDVTLEKEPTEVTITNFLPIVRKSASLSALGVLATSLAAFAWFRVRKM